MVLFETRMCNKALHGLKKDGVIDCPASGTEVEQCSWNCGRCLREGISLFSEFLFRPDVKKANSLSL